MSRGGKGAKIAIWRFPKMGEVPRNHPCELDVPFLTIQLWGVPFMETSICDTKICFPLVP